MARRIFAFEGDGNVVQYEGGFTDYQAAYLMKHPNCQAEMVQAGAAPAETGAEPETAVVRKCRRKCAGSGR